MCVFARKAQNKILNGILVNEIPLELEMTEISNEKQLSHLSIHVDRSSWVLRYNRELPPENKNNNKNKRKIFESFDARDFQKKQSPDGNEIKQYYRKKIIFFVGIVRVVCARRLTADSVARAPTKQHLLYMRCQNETKRYYTNMTQRRIYLA